MYSCNWVIFTEFSQFWLFLSIWIIYLYWHDWEIIIFYWAIVFKWGLQSYFSGAFIFLDLTQLFRYHWNILLFHIGELFPRRLSPTKRIENVQKRHSHVDENYQGKQGVCKKYLIDIDKYLCVDTGDERVGPVTADGGQLQTLGWWWLSLDPATHTLTITIRGELEKKVHHLQSSKCCHQSENKWTALHTNPIICHWAWVENIGRFAGDFI